jgi:polysaccharide pyruvyl transferase WcaK-like protein
MHAQVMTRMLIVIYGGYSCGNYGDELILEGTTRRLRAQLPSNAEVEFVVWPIVTVRALVRHPYKEIGYGNTVELVRFLRRADLIVFGGGGLLQEYGSTANSMLAALLKDVAFAHAFNQRLIMVGVGVGPLVPDSAQKLDRLGRLVPLFGVRDQVSQALLADHVPDSRVVDIGDSAFYATVATTTWQETADPQVGFAINPFYLYSNQSDQDNAHQRAIYIEYIKHLVASGFSIRLFVFQAGHEGDLAECHAIRDNLPSLSDRIAIISFVDNASFASLFAECACVVGMRLHSMILSAILQVPLLPVPYHPKCRTFVQEAKLQEYAVDYENLSLEDLVDKGAKVMADSERLRGQWQQTSSAFRRSNEAAFSAMMQAVSRAPSRMLWSESAVVLLKRSKWAAINNARRLLRTLRVYWS